ncbi:hypothetical protein SAMN04487886_11206 [Clostridium sp. DSM 8431]|uniref:DUF6512 family protein n=1 Tax=Clostridium sp. DSM 8431 TaxID=1761781 RepID=UPI0008ED55A3|nr:DUF6512 family protein [Clostridium sp. DSM 8431]SFU72567.1 hypothetical protein SAMN04487886_11206 [Clostridium sp. DSM 8431]
MIKEFEKRDIKLINKIILSGTLIIFLLSSLFHFLFNITGGSTIAAIFFPVNESVFEHLKLVLYPSIIFWIASYFILNKNYKISFSKWVISMTLSIITNMLFILACFYVARYAFNIESLILDILSILIGSFLGQLLGMHFYNNGQKNIFLSSICILLIIIMCISFANFTFYPPKLPLFMELSSGKYGI